VAAVSAAFNKKKTKKFEEQHFPPVIFTSFALVLKPTEAGYYWESRILSTAPAQIGLLEKLRFLCNLNSEYRCQLKPKITVIYRYS